MNWSHDLPCGNRSMLLQREGPDLAHSRLGHNRRLVRSWRKLTCEGIWIAQVYEAADYRGFRNQLAQHLKPLCPQQISEIAHAGDVAARPIEARHQARLDWVDGAA